MLAIAAVVLAGGTVVYSAVRGIRNNNPGNIALTNPATAWEGQQLPNTDGTFVQFTDATYGIRALGKVLNNYYAAGYQTVQDIINRWAPPTENDTGSYVADVAAKLGVNAGDVLDFSTQLQPLVAAIISHENGLNPYSDATIAAGLALA